jgi:hypothetical protein
MAIQRGEIYFVNLNPVQGREQAGQRPVLVPSVDSINRLPLVVTVVVGTKGENITRASAKRASSSASSPGRLSERISCANPAPAHRGWAHENRPRDTRPLDCTKRILRDASNSWSKPRSPLAPKLKIELA